MAHYDAMGGMRRVVQIAVDEVLSVDPDQRTHQLAEFRAGFINLRRRVTGVLE